MSNPINDNPFEPWNGFDGDNPFAPHNGPDSDNPFKPWNNPFGSKRDLSEREKEWYERHN